ncbi:hypothetical protein J2Y89_003223 [Curtobacterium herbarum]|uniref:hypothetical protein n=1 Tax=Curtobacterium TaxID=2034 RepID=UPI00209EC3FD|nr:MULTISPECIES: hypothetical protein [Curtobacterium]MCP1504479.1 hypothetical protein [Curtobacterium herbarum]MDN4648286.1 hypothetical protein [Curtobacterium sp. PsM8]
MSTIAAVLAATTPSPSPSGVPDVDVTPGVAGFVAIALVAIVTILLVVDMTRRIRRTRYRAEIRERLEAEVAGDSADGPVTDEPRRRADEDGRSDVGDDTERG